LKTLFRIFNPNTQIIWVITIVYEVIEMNEYDFGPDYHPRVGSARIRDTTPRKIGSRLEEEYKDADNSMEQALNRIEPSRREHEAVPGLEALGGADFMAHVASMQSIEATLPEPRRVDRWSNSVRRMYDDGAPRTVFEIGLDKYVSSVYSENVSWDYDGIEVESADDTDVTLSVDLYYEPDADFIDEVSLPGELEVSGTRQHFGDSGGIEKKESKW
jgi:hypothetical protein